MIVTSGLTLEGYTTKYPAIQYSYLIEIKYMKPTPADRDNKDNIDKNTLEQLKKSARDQLNRYSLDERFKKIIGKTQLIRLVLIFSGHRLVYMGSV